MADTVLVAVRTRPLNQSETERTSGSCLVTSVNAPQISVPPDLKLTYNHVFDPSKTQEEVYNTATKNLIIKLFKGYNVTILAYGQTGSGKTYSIGAAYSGESGTEGSS
ncbi:unnamed protein product [Bemisia tabaci]|uniref:Kinesin motor domain-containing protein n=1 Tax=Bemisia tabaci TaxID=7038 RepID=A0A9P0F3W3_BEMTA|nr:unnamed protein product [Bemisia tabaci]